MIARGGKGERLREEERRVGLRAHPALMNFSRLAQGEARKSPQISRGSGLPRLALAAQQRAFGSAVPQRRRNVSAAQVHGLGWALFFAGAWAGLYDGDDVKV